MEISTINRLVGGQQEAYGIYRTIETCNAGGSNSPNYEAEDLEDLEAISLNLKLLFEIKSNISK